MNVVIKHIALIERIDRLTRLQATGSPEALASRLEISKATLTRIIFIMRELDAPIAYDFTVQSYVYHESVVFRFGFFIKDASLLNEKKLKN